MNVEDDAGRIDIGQEYSRFDDNEKSFIIGKGESEIFYPFAGKVDRSFENKEFSVFFFSKVGLNENDIYQVRDIERDRLRVGWCIPINALESTEHSYAENPHFQQYAFAAVKEVIASRWVQRELAEYSGKSFALSDFFHPFTAVLVLSKEKLEETFDLQRFIPSMQSWGYVVSFNRRDKDRNPELIQVVKEIPANSQYLDLKPVSKDIENLAFVCSIFSNIFAYERNPVFRFFYLYQIFELLIELVFENEQKQLINVLAHPDTDSSRAKDLFEKAKELASEKYRIALVFTAYGCNKIDLSSLKNECNKLLLAIDKKEGRSVEKFFYPIRNFLFHQLRDLSAEKAELLDAVTNSMCDLLPEVLASFSLPMPARLKVVPFDGDTRVADFVMGDETGR